MTLGLASLGVYGVLSYGVAQRAPEIGVRLALGAHPGAIVRIVMREGRVLLVGMAAGWPAAVLLGSAIKVLLFGVGCNRCGYLHAVATGHRGQRAGGSVRTRDAPPGWNRQSCFT